MQKVTSSINIISGYHGLTELPSIISNYAKLSDERTISSKSRYSRAVKENFLSFPDDQTEALFKAALASDKLTYQAKLNVIALQLYTNDYLFQLMFSGCFINILMSGRKAIYKRDIVAFLKEEVSNGKLNVSWSRNTIERLGGNFLTILKKIGLVEGKAQKTILDPYTRSDFLTFFHFWVDAHHESADVFSSQFFPFLLLSKEKYIFLMRQQEIREKIDWYYTGDKFNIEPKLTISQYTDELST